MASPRAQPTQPSHRYRRTMARVEAAAGDLCTAALERMTRELSWYRAMPAERRSWIGLIVRAGLDGFSTWLRDPATTAELPRGVFGTAPPEMARAVSLQQTVALVRLTVDVLEERVDTLAAPGEADWLRSALLRYSRELAFATARVYAQAAEARGAWDARLEAVIVDAVLRGERDEVLHSRAAALGWHQPGSVSVVVGSAPDQDTQVVAHGIHRLAGAAHLDVLVGVQGERLVVILGGIADPVTAAGAVIRQFGPGPVVAGPAVADLASCTRSARAALSGLRAAPAWPQAPRPVAAGALLAERAILGDPAAKRELVEEIYRPLADAGSSLLHTVAVYLEQASSLEGAARDLYVHPNTVRYRLRRVVEVTGVDPGSGRDALLLRLALALGRLGGERPS